MEKRVTIEILKESQASRPRHWVPVFAWIALVISVLFGLAFIALWFNTLPFFSAIAALIPDMTISIAGTDFTLFWLIQVVFGPGALFVVGLILLIMALRICSFRHVYWWLGAPLLIALIGQVLFLGFFALFYLVPAIHNIFAGIPDNVMVLLLTIYAYVNIVWPFVMAFFWLICVFYNINYPAKYEEIYVLRGNRIKAYRTSDERIAYKKRFYDDYKRGNWISMMLDLHFEALEKGSTKPIREDALEFLIYYTGLCDATVNTAVINQYVSEGRYYEARDLFHGVKEKADSINRGAHIILPHYVPDKRKPKPKKPTKAETPKVMPPLKPAEYKRPADDRVKTWSPDDI